MSFANNGAAKEQIMSANGGTNGAVDGLSPEDERQQHLERMRTAGSIAMSPELFEKLYLSPQTAVKGELRKTFANPTPVALVGFLIALTPLSATLMEWRGAGGDGAATTGVYFFMGGLLMFVGGILEWVLGNSFASVVFLTFGGFWFSFGATLVPSFGAYAAYAPAGEEAAVGLATRGFNAGLGFWFVFMGAVCFIFLICALRTNIVFVLIFLSLMTAFFLLTGARWALADDFVGNAAIARRCAIAAGACAFVTCMCGWYLLLAIMLGIVDFPIQIPVGDLSGFIKGRSEKQRAAKGY